ncbi:MAG: PDZ domain-containing protein [Clostridia bacterium]|nr:PDZ domain-containing protein [Clostridia bacterium]
MGSEEQLKEEAQVSLSLPAEREEKTENPSLPPAKKDKKAKSNPKSKKKKVLTGIIAVALAAVGFVVGLGVQPLFMDAEMRSLMQIKNAIQDDYLYEVSDEMFYSTLFDAINDDLLDPYSKYMTKEEYAENLTAAEGQRSGIGVVYTTTEEGKKVYVDFVRGNSPAEDAGLQRGDRLVAVGSSQTQLTEVQSYQHFKELVLAQGYGVPFYLQYERGSALSTVSVANRTFAENYVYYRTGETSFAFTGAEATTMQEKNNPIVGLPEDVAYIRLTQFNGNAAQQFSSAMNLFKEEGKKRLVLDLRGNGGGYMDVLSSISSYFCKSATSFAPTVATAVYADGDKEYFHANGNVYSRYFAEDSEIYLLADDGTASASECLIGCMVDYGALNLQNVCLFEKDGVAKTYGKGIMQTTYTFGAGDTDAIRLTTARIQWPISGRCIHGVGVTTADGCKSALYSFTQDGEVYAGLTALGIL